jgi:hypothetical protein
MPSLYDVLLASEMGKQAGLQGYTHGMADDAVFDEIQDNTKEAGQRLRASLNLLRSQGMLDDANHRELVTRLSTSLAMVEASYLEARRRAGA